MTALLSAIRAYLCVHAASRLCEHEGRRTVGLPFWSLAGFSELGWRHGRLRAVHTPLMRNSAMKSSAAAVIISCCCSGLNFGPAGCKGDIRLVRKGLRADKATAKTRVFCSAPSWADALPDECMDDEHTIRLGYVPLLRRKPARRFTNRYDKYGGSMRWVGYYRCRQHRQRFTKKPE